MHARLSEVFDYMKIGGNFAVARDDETSSETFAIGSLGFNQDYAGTTLNLAPDSQLIPERARSWLVRDDR